MCVCARDPMSVYITYILHCCAAAFCFFDFVSYKYISIYVYISKLDILIRFQGFLRVR